MKTISELHIKQYGCKLKSPQSWDYEELDLSNDSFWLYFNIDYKECKTKDLLLMLKTLRKYQSMCNQNHEEKFLKLITPIKNELSKREHLPNKKERKEIRKQKAKLK